MKSMTLRDLLSRTAAVRKALKKEHEIVMTDRGRPVAVMAEVDGKTLAAKLMAVRGTQALLPLDRGPAKAAGLDKMTMEEIDAEIARARAEQRAGEAKAKIRKRATAKNAK